jgi:hypothetical protein
MSKDDFRQPVAGTTDLTRWEVNARLARRKEPVRELAYHHCFETYDTATAADALERFFKAYECAPDSPAPIVKQGDL